ncbi:hypothetical protein H1R20_g3814, partial [Candolleomyces eurysporus]
MKFSEKQSVALATRSSDGPHDDNRIVLVIHGGAGTMSKDASTPTQRRAYKVALSNALKAGYAVLHDGGEALDAAVAAVSVLEDNPLFNAGKGAVFNTAGKNELEASVMLSKPPSSHPAIPKSRRGAALTLLTRARNPSKLARTIYLHPELVGHAFMSGSTAEQIGERLGEELVDPSYFFTEHRWREHRRGLGLPEEPIPNPTSNCSESRRSADLIDLRDPEHQSNGVRAAVPSCVSNKNSGHPDLPLDSFPTGTVGAVALDVRGCIAAVTSTGGRTNKLPGRIGDTPLMGAGFWAEEWEHDAGDLRKSGEWMLLPSWLREMWDRFHGQRSDTTREKTGKAAVGVSGTGDGDFFIRQSTASTVARRMQLAGESVEDASEKVVRDLFSDGGIGGVIALDNRGNVAMPLNCSGMYRGVVRADGIPKVAIFDDDVLEEIDND